MRQERSVARPLEQGLLECLPGSLIHSLLTPIGHLNTDDNIRRLGDGGLVKAHPDHEPTGQERHGIRPPAGRDGQVFTFKPRDQHRDSAPRYIAFAGILGTLSTKLAAIAFQRQASRLLSRFHWPRTAHDGLILFATVSHLPRCRR